MRRRGTSARLAQRDAAAAYAALAEAEKALAACDPDEYDAHVSALQTAAADYVAAVDDFEDAEKENE